MKTQNLIERYMSQLDQYLAHIPATEKAEIILELNAHIQDSLQNGNKDVEEVLNNLGTPEEAARRYLEERGLSLSMPKLSGQKSETGKWLTIAFLGSFGLSIAFAIFIMTFFSPLVDVQEEEGKVRILGGLINVQEDMTSKNKGKKRKDKKIKAHLKFSGTDQGKEKHVEINVDGDKESPNIEIKVDGDQLKEDQIKLIENLKNLEGEIEGLSDLEKLEKLSELEGLKNLKELKSLKELKNLKIFEELRELKELKVEKESPTEEAQAK